MQLKFLSIPVVSVTSVAEAAVAQSNIKVLEYPGLTPSEPRSSSYTGYFICCGG